MRVAEAKKKKEEDEAERTAEEALASLRLPRTSEALRAAKDDLKAATEEAQAAESRLRKVEANIQTLAEKRDVAAQAMTEAELQIATIRQVKNLVVLFLF